MKKRILIFTVYYLPGYKGGGPIQSVSNLVSNLSDIFDFYILTSDRDLGDETPYKGIKTDTWIKTGQVSVYYVDKRKLTWRKLKAIINAVNYDVFYINGFFTYRYSIMPLLLRQLRIIPMQKVVLSPRGEFSKGAFGLKKWKKSLFLSFSKIMCIHRNVIWHATNAYEKEDIIGRIGNHAKVLVVKNFTKKNTNTEFTKKLTKEPGMLKLLYLARIHPMKNLLQVLNVLKKIDDNVEFNICGPIEDKNYWTQCQNAISELGSNILVNYLGEVSSLKVNEIYSQNHVYILLTLGENFGHTIAEALMDGCPVIISNRTPWKYLDKANAGWDLSLDDNEMIHEKIKFFVNCNEVEYLNMSENAFEYIKQNANNENDVALYRNLFDEFWLRSHKMQVL